MGSGPGAQLNFVAPQAGGAVRLLEAEIQAIGPVSGF